VVSSFILKEAARSILHVEITETTTLSYVTGVTTSMLTNAEVEKWSFGYNVMRIKLAVAGEFYNKLNYIDKITES
jgi:hypothetical protein